MTHFLEALKKYAVFNGRTSKAGYWYFALVFTFFTILFILIDFSIIFLIQPKPWFFFSSLVYSLVLFIPWWSISVRRLHDIGKSGWLLFSLLVPIIGPFILMAFFLRKGTPQKNSYGNSPELG